MREAIRVNTLQHVLITKYLVGSSPIGRLEI